jgi:hypothetical protein
LSSEIVFLPVTCGATGIEAEASLSNCEICACAAFDSTTDGDTTPR